MVWRGASVWRVAKFARMVEKSMFETRGGSKVCCVNLDG